MQIEIVAIGDEILLGSTLNTNATFISKKLKQKGYSVSYHSVFPDDAKILKEALSRALKRSDIVIATGGLGPTGDDTTKKVAAKLFKKKLICDEKLKKKLFQRFSKNKYIESQSYIPKDTLIIENSIGTAPGFIFEKEKKALILLPGVPFEMERMLPPSLRYIEKNYPLKEKIYQDELNFCFLKETDLEPFLEKLKKTGLEIGIYPSINRIKVSFLSKDKNRKTALLKIKNAKKTLEERFKKNIYPKGLLEEAIKNIFIKKKKKLALAESCTGGALATALTKISGASNYFLGSIVSYSNELKKNILHVKEKTLKTKGAVSNETVKEMVLGLFKITDADFALSISGVAGPSGGTKQKPVGTVYIALSERGKKIESYRIQVSGDRDFIINYSVYFALSLLWVKISGNLAYFNHAK